MFSVLHHWLFRKPIRYLGILVIEFEYSLLVLLKIEVEVARSDNYAKTLELLS
jgi:hypothetical protein